MRTVGGAIGVLALLVVVVAGLLGPTNLTDNPSQLIVWVYFWPGLLVVSAVVGDVWELLNPWAALHRIRTRVGAPSPRPLPARPDRGAVQALRAGLLEPVPPARWSWTALVMLNLGAVLFDALLPTSIWLQLASRKLLKGPPVTPDVLAARALDVVGPP